MADRLKAEKVAAARKKLKEFQQKTKDATNSTSKNKNASRKNIALSKDDINNTVATPHLVPDSGPNEIHQTINSPSNVQYTTLTGREPGEHSYAQDSVTNIGPNLNQHNISSSYTATPLHHEATDFFDNLPVTNNYNWRPTESTTGSSSFSSDVVSQSPLKPVAALPLVLDSPMYSTYSQPFTYEHSPMPTMSPIPDHYEPTMFTHSDHIDESVSPVLSDHVEGITSIISNSKHFDPLINPVKDPSMSSNPISLSTEHFDLTINPGHTMLLDTFMNPNPSELNLFDKIISPISPESRQLDEKINPILSDDLNVFDQLMNPPPVSTELFYPIAKPISSSPELTLSISPTMESQLIPSDLFSSTTNIDSPHATSERPIKIEQLGDAELGPLKVEYEDNVFTSPRSTTENIRQLSMQVNGLIAESTPIIDPSVTSELEQRNQELAALLSFEKQCTEQLKLQLEEYQLRTSQLTSEMESRLADAEARHKAEIAPIQQQLQLHAQTLGILVAEKTELQSTLSQCQHAAKQGVAQAEELQGRLKASRHRVADLEKELSGLRSSGQQSDSSRQTLATQLEQLELQQKITNSRIQEMEDEKQETMHRLSSKTAECSELGNEMFELRTQLSLAQLRVDQLSSSDNVDTTSHLETLHLAKVALERQVSDLQVSVKQVAAESADASQQYQQYVATLDTQLQSLQNQVETLTADNARLTADNARLTDKEDSRVKHVTALEKRLQEQPASGADQQPIVAQLTTQVQTLETEKQVLHSQLAERLREAESYDSQMNEREARIEELEAMLDRMQGDQPDQALLLAAMESDKVAAARATSQNQRLKQQLEELQTGFVDLSNCKLDLTDKLQHERHVTKELTLQISQMASELEDLRMKHNHSGHDHTGHDHTGHDHAAHNHAGHDHNEHDHAAHDREIVGILHRELERSKERIEALSVQNIELRTLLSQKGVTDRPGDEKDEQLAALSASVTQLQEERAELIGRLSGDSNEPIVTKQAMDQLQARFTSTMQEVADLSDEKQRLEHLVLQLQGETETIGEYITLYQKQRSLLRQRAQEKDTQLKCLSQDREEMRAKLSQLNQLIQRLVAEKGVEATDAVLDNLKHERLSAEEGADKFTHNGFTNGELTELSKNMNGAETPPVETADKIMALLTEIGSSNLVDPQQLVEHFHPCAWCSGRLITV